jgi:hypothetical protein
MKAACLMHLPLLALLFSRVCYCEAGGRKQLRTGIAFQNIYSILFISLLLRKRSGFWLNSVSGSKKNKNWLSGSLDYSLLFKNWGCWERLFVTLGAPEVWHSPGSWGDDLCLLRRQAMSWTQTSIC